MKRRFPTELRLLTGMVLFVAAVASSCGGQGREFAVEPEDVEVTATVGRKDYDEPPIPTTIPPTATVVPDRTPGPTSTPTATPTAPPAATATAVPAATVTSVPTATPSPTPAAPPAPVYFPTLAPGANLPSDAECAALVRADPRPETHPENVEANTSAGGPSVLIDGAHNFRDNELADRISGNFTGTTDEILRWASCKWGIDEDLTRARAWTESSWSIETQGDRTDSASACALIGLSAPCNQSHGLLQVKGTVHEGTYPYASASTAWGVDYAMAWQRACYEGAFTWLDDEGYTAGDMTGCVGAWYSGHWYNDSALGYLEDVQERADQRPWS